METPEQRLSTWNNAQSIASDIVTAGDSSTDYSFNNVFEDHSEYDLPEENVLEAAYTATEIAVTEDGKMDTTKLVKSIAKWVQNAVGGGDSSVDSDTDSVDEEPDSGESAGDHTVHNQSDLDGWNKARSVGTDLVKFYEGERAYGEIRDEHPGLEYPDEETIREVVSDSKPDDETRVEWINEVARWVKDREWKSVDTEDPSDGTDEQHSETGDSVNESEQKDTAGTSDPPDSGKSVDDSESDDVVSESDPTKSVQPGTVLSSEDGTDTSGSPEENGSVDVNSNGADVDESVATNGNAHVDSDDISFEATSDSDDSRREREVATKLFTVFVKSGDYTYKDVSEEVDDLTLPPRTEALMATVNSKGETEQERIKNLTDTVLEWQEDGAEQDWGGTPYAPGSKTKTRW